MKIAAVVQARMSSTRLPGKVLKELPYGSGITVLQQVIRRLSKSKKLDDIIIATTMDKTDDEIVRLCEKENIKWFRGSVDDVLERYYLAAKDNGLDVVVRVTSDCPCVDAEIADSLIQEHISVCADFLSNASLTYPHGLEMEIWNFGLLEQVHRKAKDSTDREQVSDYIYRKKPQGFKIQTVRAPKKLTAPQIRITLDTEEDYTLLCAVFDYLYSTNEFFVTKDVIKLFGEKPWLKAINKNTVDHTIDTLKACS